MPIASLVLASGCGSGLWLITPRPNVTHYEVARTTNVEVTSVPAGATLFVDGAEAGRTPRSIAAPYKEIRRQRRQAVWPAVLGTLVDVVGSALVIGQVIDHQDDNTMLVAGSVVAGIGIVVLDMYLIAGRSTVDEGFDLAPAPIELGVRAPGFADAARRIRVPDYTKVNFVLEPGTPATSTPPVVPPSPQPLPPPR